MGGQILIAAGHAQDAMNFSGVAMVFFLAAVALAAPYGITYAAAAGGLANLPVLPNYLRRLRHHFGIDLKRWLFEQLPCRTATAAMVAIVLGSIRISCWHCYDLDEIRGELRCVLMNSSFCWACCLD